LLGDIDPTTSFAVVSDQDSRGAVVDLADGRVIARDANAVARDHVLETTVVVSGTTVRGLEDDGTEKWTHEDPEPLQLLSAGERLAYAVRPEEGTPVVLDTNRGGMGQPHDVGQEGPLAVPQRFSADSAAAVRVQEQPFPVPAGFDGGAGQRGWTAEPPAGPRPPRPPCGSRSSSSWSRPSSTRSTASGDDRLSSSPPRAHSGTAHPFSSSVAYGATRVIAEPTSAASRAARAVVGTSAERAAA